MPHVEHVKYTILELVRMPGVLVWALAFPLILSTVFMMMFGPLDDQSEIDPIPLVAVDPPMTSRGVVPGFSRRLSDDGNGESLFAITYVPNAEEALAPRREEHDGREPLRWLRAALGRHP